MNVTKFQDSFNDSQSRADEYWTASNIQRFYRNFRKPMELPKNYLLDSNSADKVIKRYQLRGFQFGNWVTNEDRFNYVASFYICLYDLNKVLKFKNNNLGLTGSLGIALGSRGVAGALAHYEPANEVINISRYIREDVLKRKIEELGQRAPKSIPKDFRFFNSGGIGSFAHEYGHFLDGTFGIYTETHKDFKFLTGKGGSVSKKRIVYSSAYPMRNLVEDMFEKILFKNGEKTSFCLRLEETQSEYLNMRQEIFARVFEQYISYKLLNRFGIQNDFMTKKKYKANHYLTETELKTIIPILDKLIDLMSKNT